MGRFSDFISGGAEPDKRRHVVGDGNPDEERSLLNSALWRYMGGLADIPASAIRGSEALHKQSDKPLAATLMDLFRNPGNESANEARNVVYSKLATPFLPRPGPDTLAQAEKVSRASEGLRDQFIGAMAARTPPAVAALADTGIDFADAAPTLAAGLGKGALRAITPLSRASSKGAFEAAFRGLGTELGEKALPSSLAEAQALIRGTAQGARPGVAGKVVDTVEDVLRPEGNFAGFEGGARDVLELDLKSQAEARYHIVRASENARKLEAGIKDLKKKGFAEADVREYADATLHGEIVPSPFAGEIDDLLAPALQHQEYLGTKGLERVERAISDIVAAGHDEAAVRGYAEHILSGKPALSAYDQLAEEGVAPIKAMLRKAEVFGDTTLQRKLDEIDVAGFSRSEAVAFAEDFIRGEPNKLKPPYARFLERALQGQKENYLKLYSEGAKESEATVAKVMEAGAPESVARATVERAMKGGNDLPEWAGEIDKAVKHPAKILDSLRTEHAQRIDDGIRAIAARGGHAEADVRGYVERVLAGEVGTKPPAFAGQVDTLIAPVRSNMDEMSTVLAENPEAITTSAAGRLNASEAFRENLGKHVKDTYELHYEPKYRKALLKDKANPEGKWQQFHSALVASETGRHARVGKMLKARLSRAEEGVSPNPHWSEIELTADELAKIIPSNLDDLVEGQIQKIVVDAGQPGVYKTGGRAVVKRMHRRKGTSEAFAEFAGKNTDATVGSTRTLEETVHNAMTVKFLKAVKELDGGKYFTPDKNPLPGMAHQVPNSPSMGPLAGHFTSERVLDAIQSGTLAGKPKGFAAQSKDAYLRMVGLSKGVLTVFSSPISHARNLNAWGYILLSSGHNPMNVVENVKSVAEMGKALFNRPTGRYMNQVRLGAVGESALLGDLQQTVSRATGKEWKPSDFFKRAWGLGDDVGKDIHYKHELKYAQEAFPDATALEHSQLAAHNTSVMTPTFSRTGPLINAAREFVPVAPFPSFFGEMVRSTGATISVGLKEIKVGAQTGNKVMMKQGMKRLAGTTMAMTAGPAAAAASWQASGLGDAVRDGLRELSPPWERDAAVMVTGYDPETKTLKTVNLSWTDPFSYMQKPFMAALNSLELDEDAWGKAAWEAFKVGTEPLWGMDPATSAMTGILFNRSEGGRPLYNEDDPMGPQGVVRKGGKRLAQVTVPRVARKAWEKWVADPGPYETGDPGAEFRWKALSGLREVEGNVLGKLFTVGQLEFRDHVSASNKAYHGRVFFDGMDPDLAQRQTIEVFAPHYTRMRIAVQGIRALPGMKDSEVRDVLMKSVGSRVVVDALMRDDEETPFTVTERGKRWRERSNQYRQGLGILRKEE